MTNYQHGHDAEKVAAAALQKQGYKIRDINWRTKYCEIDIIGEKKNVMYFVEVKYRQNDNQGQGIDYITPKKLEQMAFAAEIWVTNNKWNGDYELAAVEVSGKLFKTGDILLLS